MCIRDRGRLQVLNKKRKRWGGREDEIVEKVRRRCAALEDLISVYPESQGKIRSVDVRISDEIDPSGTLRNRIKETKFADSSDSDCENHSYPPDRKEKIEEEDQANSCYHTTQMEMADILKKRIKTIMRHYHGIEGLSSAFDDIDFVVYTCLLYTSPSPRDLSTSRMPSSA